MLKRITIFLLTVILASFAYSDGSALAGLHGDRIRPYLSVREVYDDNIFRVRDEGQLKSSIGDDQLADYLTIYTLGLNLDYRWSRQGLGVQMRKDFLRYGHYTSQNSGQDDVRGDLSLRVLDRISAKITGGYSRLIESKESYRTQEKNERTTKAAGISLAYKLPSGVDIHTALSQEEVDFSLSELNSRENTRRGYSGGISYSPSPDTGFDVHYERNIIDYDITQFIGGRPVNNDNVGESVRAGFRRGFSPGTLLSINTGYLWRGHREFSGRDFEGVVGKAGVNYSMTGKLTLSLTAERRLYEEIFLDQIYSANDSIGLGLVYRPAAKIDVSIYGGASTKTFNGDSDIVTDSGTAREDRFKEFRTGIAWSPVRSFVADLRYSNTARDSNFDIYNYRDNILEGGISYKF